MAAKKMAMISRSNLFLKITEERVEQANTIKNDYQLKL